MHKDTAKWIWYPGDFEIYHSMLVNSRREERDHQWPTFWRLDDCWHNLRFEKKYVLEKGETFHVSGHGIGYIEVNYVKYPFNSTIHVPAGECKIVVCITKLDGLPCLFVKGDTVNTDESWLVHNGNGKWVNAASHDMYTSPDTTPEAFPFSYEEIYPVSQQNCNGGILYDFGKQTFAKLKFNEIQLEKNLPVYFGESETEALDTEYCYLIDEINADQMEQSMNARGFRYIFIPETTGSYQISADYEYIPFNYRGNFRCSNEMINKIWNVASYTLHINSREFFLDGVKRDRWVWSGDAYQSFLVNYYLFFDRDICKRTILALRGKDPMDTHINTILDYSFYWVIGIYDYYIYTGDKDFISFIYPKMKTLMDFCLSRRDEYGLVSGLEGDWVFIDWADIDKTGPVCAEQILFAKSLEAMALCSALAGEDGTQYENLAQDVKEKINRYYWNEVLGGFIDSFVSGKNNLTRHANIFALLFDYVTEQQRETIIKNVILNDNIPQIKTPYFKFFELDTMCNIGNLEYAEKELLDYWGGMIDLGATTFWEEYDPKLDGAAHYEMYGNKYGKSLCHAWGASPVYLTGKYYMGVKPTSPGYESFEVVPKLGGLDWFEGVVPVNDGDVSVSMNKESLKVTATKAGGTLVYQTERIPLIKNKTVEIKLK